MQQQQQQNSIQKLQKQVGTYKVNLLKVLGEGQFGKVYVAASDLNKKYYACKQVSIQKTTQGKQQTLILQELEVLRKIKHENLVSLYNYYESASSYYFFLDLCQNGTLTHYLQQKQYKLSENEAMSIFAQICEGYNYLYNHQIMHRDLKPDNILIHGQTLKIGDFGFGKIIDGDMETAQIQSTKCTPLFASPQLLARKAYSSKCDVWSLGIILYILLAGTVPFSGNSETELFNDIQNKTRHQPLQIDNKKLRLNIRVVSLIQNMLRFEEIDRFSFQQVYQEKIWAIQKENNAQQQNDIPEQDEQLKQDILKSRQDINENNLVVDRLYTTNLQELEQNQQNQKLNLAWSKLTDDDLFQISKEKDVDVKNQLIEKVIYYARNKAKFCSYAAELFYNNQKELISLKVPDYQIKAILYCLISTYFLRMASLYKQIQIIKQHKIPDILQNSNIQNQLTEENMKEYSQSKYFQEIMQIVYSDHTHAKSYYNNYQLQRVKEHSLLSQDKLNDAKLQEAYKMIISKEIDDEKFKNLAKSTFKDICNTVDLNKLSHNALRTIVALQMFAQFSSLFSSKLYDQFDFKKFYEDYFKKATEEELKLKIISYQKTV